LVTVACGIATLGPCYQIKPMPRSKGWGMPKQRQQKDAARVDSFFAGGRDDRTTIFTKTKMCRFNILGMCSRGEDCKFAHHREELNPLPDLSRTKLCKSLIFAGTCDDPACRYAHNADELRTVPTALTRQDSNSRPSVRGARGHRAILRRPMRQHGAAVPHREHRQAAAIQRLLSGMAAAGVAVHHVPQEASLLMPQEALVAGHPAPPHEDAGSAAHPEAQQTQRTGPQASNACAPDMRLVVKNTFLDLNVESATRRPARSSTWAGAIRRLAGDCPWRYDGEPGSSCITPVAPATSLLGLSQVDLEPATVVSPYATCFQGTSLSNQVAASSNVVRAQCALRTFSKECTEVVEELSMCGMTAPLVESSRASRSFKADLRSSLQPSTSSAHVRDQVPLPALLTSGSNAAKSTLRAT